MSADIISLRVLVVTPAASLRALLRQAAGGASVPAEVAEADGSAAAEPLIAEGIDLILLDSAMAAAEKASVCRAARAAKERPFVISIGTDGDGIEVDGSVHKPGTPQDAQKIAGSCIRSRFPTRVLIVDDSATMRGIVRKIISASKFPMEVSDTQDGIKALEELRKGNFDVIFLDYNMPGFDGFEIMSELRRLRSPVAVAMMTSTDNPTFAARALAAGAAAFLKKPFFPADIDSVLYRFYNIDPPARVG